jgi:tetratricopeptide (TPR) repeat protein
MTFAVLPFQAPADDKAGAQVAVAMTEAAFTVEESRVLWAQVASRRSVEQALAKHAAPKDLATDLNVHFLLRGNVTRAASGYNVEMLVVDGATERVLGTYSLVVPAGALTPRYHEDVENALGQLNYYGLRAEVERARGKPIEALDVRDLSFRAYVDWGDKKQQKDEKGAYVTATDLLNRALMLAPDDPLALYLTARVNLCDCIDAWSKNVEQQQAIGEAAMEKYLRHDSENPRMLALKGELFGLRGRFEESLQIVEAMLKRDPENSEALATKAYDLLKLGRPQEALLTLNDFHDRDVEWPVNALAAAVHYELAQYELSVPLAQKAAAKMNREDLSNPKSGAVRLTLVAAEARLGHLSRAKAALADFNAAVPGVRTISEMKKWMHPAADLAGYEPLFDGLRLAGVSD